MAGVSRGIRRTTSATPGRHLSDTKATQRRHLSKTTTSRLLRVGSDPAASAPTVYPDGCRSVTEPDRRKPGCRTIQAAVIRASRRRDSRGRVTSQVTCHVTSRINAQITPSRLEPNVTARRRETHERFNPAVFRVGVERIVSAICIVGIGII